MITGLPHVYLKCSEPALGGASWHEHLALLTLDGGRRVMYTGDVALLLCGCRLSLVAGAVQLGVNEGTLS